MAVLEDVPYQREVSRGFAQAQAGDLETVRRDMALEQQWQANEPRYQNNAQVEAAYQAGELVLVEPTEYYRLIKRLLAESNNRPIHQPYLKPGAAKALNWLTGRAHDHLASFGINGEEIRFPVTSLVRSMERQEHIAAEPGKLAISPYESGHPTGWDFDIDSSSYYLLEDGQWKSVSRRNTERQRQLNFAHQRVLGEIATPTLIAGPEKYNPRVRLALHYAAAEFYTQSILAPVVEYANTPNELIHVGVNPSVFKA